MCVCPNLAPKSTRIFILRKGLMAYLFHDSKLTLAECDVSAALVLNELNLDLPSSFLVLSLLLLVTIYGHIEFIRILRGVHLVEVGCAKLE